MTDWRAIPLDQIDWFSNTVGRTRLVPFILCRLSRKTGDGPYEAGEWDGWTLGQLADAGENRWIRSAGVGRIGVLIIMEIIDRAAAGEDVTVKDAGTHSYVPQPWPRKPPAKETER